MVSKVNYWKNLIFLNWDGEMPAAAQNVQHLIKMNPGDVIPYWTHLKGRIKYSAKNQSFYLALSLQNIERLKRQFGEKIVIPEERCLALLEKKQQEIAKYEKMKRLLVESPDSDIYYKVKPLAKYQAVGVSYLVASPIVPLFADCGVGKTYMVLVATQELMRRGELTPGKVLVCGKLPTLYNGWLEDCKKFTDLKAQVLWEKSTTRRKDKLLKKLRDEADIYIINHEGLKVLKDALIAKNFESVIVDESTVLKGFHGTHFGGGAFGKALMEVSHRAKRRVIMSGTPASNGYHDLWGQFHFLDPEGVLLEPSFSDFRERFMDQFFFGNPNNPNTVSTWRPISSAIPEIQKLTEPLIYRVRIRDHLKDLPESTEVQRLCTMEKEQSTHYKRLEEELYTEIGDEVVSTLSAMTNIMKLRQVTSGFLITPKGEEIPMSSSCKFDVLDSLIYDEIDKSHKVVIYAQYRWEIRQIEERYRDEGICSVYGGNPSHVNLKNIDNFINMPAIRIIVLHPKSAAHGITFVNAHYMVFFSISFSEEDNYQCKARIERSGQRHPMFFFYILCEDSIDTIIYEALKKKKKTQQALIDSEIVSNFILTAANKKR
jgi:SNF2 family DNA or RNA helicase